MASELETLLSSGLERKHSEGIFKMQHQAGLNTLLDIWPLS